MRMHNCIMQEVARSPKSLCLVLNLNLVLLQVLVVNYSDWLSLSLPLGYFLL